MFLERVLNLTGKFWNNKVGMIDWCYSPSSLGASQPKKVCVLLPAATHVIRPVPISVAGPGWLDLYSSVAQY